MNNQSPSIQLFSHNSLLPHSIRRFRADACDARVFQFLANHHTVLSPGVSIFLLDYLYDLLRQLLIHVHCVSLLYGVAGTFHINANKSNIRSWSGPRESGNLTRCHFPLPPLPPAYLQIILMTLLITIFRLSAAFFLFLFYFSLPSSIIV
jgi:hypothetical protein